MENGPGDVFDVHGLLHADLAVRLRGALLHAGGHLGQRVANIDLADGNPVRATIQRGRLCEPRHGVLGCRVWGGVGAGNVGGDGTVC